tara:strand:- start:229 stop:849 length:621 start_codon:yes stop_codon:yes gene_type:complete
MSETKESISQRFRRNFLYGLIVILPVAVTFWLLKLLINLFSGPFSSLFGDQVPEVVFFIVGIILIALVGFIARNIIGRYLLKIIEGIMTRIPIIKTIYGSVKQIVTAFSFQNKGLLSAVLVEYPRKGIWALGFLTQENVVGLLDDKGTDLGENKVAVFVPTTPNPTSGYYVYFDEKDVKKLAMSVEDSVKVLMSAGVVNPGQASSS